MSAGHTSSASRRGALACAVLMLGTFGVAAWDVPAARGQARSSAGRAIQAAAYVNEQGQMVAGGLLLIEGESIAQIGGDREASEAGDVPVDVYPGAVLSPGLIDCHSALAAAGDLSEREHALQPHVNARDAFDRYSHQLRLALVAGVTTFALAPDDRNLVGGRIAICQTAGPDGWPRVLSDAGPLKLSLSVDVYRPEREPTSRSGALGMLREAIETARAGVPQDDPLTAFAAGALPGFIAAPSGADVLACLQLGQEYGVRLVPIHTRDARRVSELASGQIAGVVVGPLDFSAGQRATEAAALFARHGTPVAIAGGLPAAPADSLRIGAALAARSGLAPAAARRAITAAAAELLGVGDRIGVLRAGYQADVVVFSADPLDLRARVLAVYVAGRRVFVADGGPQSGDVP